MTRETIYIVQGFNAGKSGSLKADKPIACKSANGAVRTAERLALSRVGVVAFSSGNHAQAIALAASLHGVTSNIIMPLDAPAAKVAATRHYGGNVITYDRYTEDREKIGRTLADCHHRYGVWRRISRAGRA